MLFVSRLRMSGNGKYRDVTLQIAPSPWL